MQHLQLSRSLPRRYAIQCDDVPPPRSISAGFLARSRGPRVMQLSKWLEVTRERETDARRCTRKWNKTMHTRADAEERLQTASSACIRHTCARGFRNIRADAGMLAAAHGSVVMTIWPSIYNTVVHNSCFIIFGVLCGLFLLRLAEFFFRSGQLHFWRCFDDYYYWGHYSCITRVLRGEILFFFLLVIYSGPH